MASTQDKQSLLKVYLAAFQRAPELEGLNYWLAEVDRNGLAKTLQTIFTLSSVQQLYPASQSDSAFVTSIYNNVFSKSPDSEGLGYWVSQLAAGGNRGALVLQMIDAGLSTPVGTAGRDAIVNRYTHASDAVTAQEKSGVSLSPSYLATQYSAITSDPSSVTQVTARVEQQVAASTSTSGAAKLTASQLMLVNDGVIDLLPSQYAGTSTVLTTAQTEFIAALEIARTLGPFNDNDDTIVESNAGGYLFHVTLNNQVMAPVRIHIGSSQLQQVETYETQVVDPALASIALKYMTAADMALLMDDSITEDNIPADLLARIGQAFAEGHQHYSAIALVGYQQAASGSMDGWVVF